MSEPKPDYAAIVFSFLRHGLAEDDPVVQAHLSLEAERARLEARLTLLEPLKGLWQDGEFPSSQAAIDDTLTNIRTLRMRLETAERERNEAQTNVKQLSKLVFDGAAYKAAMRERDEARGAIRKFLAQWKEAQPLISGAFAMMSAHGGRYNGPTLTEEIKEFQRLATEPDECEYGTGYKDAHEEYLPTPTPRAEKEE